MSSSRKQFRAVPEQFPEPLADEQFQTCAVPFLGNCTWELLSEVDRTNVDSPTRNYSAELLTEGERARCRRRVSPRLTETPAS